MKNISKKINLVVKVLILIVIISLFIALYILNVENVDNTSKLKDNSDEIVNNESNSWKYIIKNEKLYVSNSNNGFHEVPVDINKIIGYDKDTQNINENLYQLSKTKIMFLYREDENVKVITSDNEGINWENKDLIKNKAQAESVVYIHFTSEDDATAIICKDVAMQKAMVKVIQTTDSGSVWKEKKTGPDGYIEVDLKSSYVFFNSNLGFISSSKNGGDSSTLYMTKDGGDSFSEVKFPEQQLSPLNNNIYLNWSQIYDFPSIPQLKDGELVVVVSQGADGDYNGGKISAKYISKDMGQSWEFVEEYVPN